MIIPIAGPLVSAPVVWNLVFERRITSWWSYLAFGRHKHVRAYGYVPFLHVWLFVDVGLRGMEVFAAGDGAPANAVIAAWIEDADVVAMNVSRDNVRRLPLAGFCVPAMKRLVGLRCGALRPSALYSHCLRNGGIPFEAADGCSAVQAAST